MRNSTTNEVRLNSRGAALYDRLRRIIRPHLTHSVILTLADGSTVEERELQKMTTRAVKSVGSGEVTFIASPGVRIKPDSGR